MNKFRQVNVLIFIVYLQHQKLNLLVYSLTWYNETADFQRLVLQFQTQLRKPFEVRSFGFATTNLNLFARAIRLTYSVLNLMLAKFGR